MGDTKRVSSSDATLEWGQFWAYFLSDYLTNDDRKWTMQFVGPHLANIHNATANVQIEILECAPKELILRLQDKLKPNVCQQLLGNTQQVQPTQSRWVSNLKKKWKEEGIEV